MPVVCTTSVVSFDPQSLVHLQQNEFVHRKKKRDRRFRKQWCFKHVILRHPYLGFVYLVYSSGRCVILGPRNMRHIHLATYWISLILRSQIICPVQVKNIVFVCGAQFNELKSPNALQRLYNRLRSSYSNIVLEPELSPALMFNSCCVQHAKIMIFRTGKINITGLKHFDEIESVKQEINKVIMNQWTVIVTPLKIQIRLILDVFDE